MTKQQLRMEPLRWWQWPAVLCGLPLFLLLAWVVLGPFGVQSKY
jgi:hypothetical protein